MGPDDAVSPFSIRLLGPFEASRGGRPIPRLRFRKSQAVLALLALRHGCEVERDWLAGLLWPDSDQAAALHSLRNCLTALRRALGLDASRLRSPTSRTLALDLDGATVDVLAFDAAVTRGSREALEEAIHQYRGPLLEGCADEWVFQERQAREQAYLSALEKLASLAMEGGDTAAAESHLRRTVAVEPLRESAQRSLMELLAAGGNYAGAMQTYQELRLRLHEEAHAEPDPETRALFERLRAEAREKASTSRIACATGRTSPSLIDAANGSGRNGDSPLTLHEPAPTNLPLPLTRFIGREGEIGSLGQRLQEPATRLVTLTGPGGSGKTRLALQAGEALREAYAGAVWFVPLLDLSDPRLIPDKLLQSLHQPHAPHLEPLEHAATALSARPSLVILDNFEHLVEGGARCVLGLLEQVRTLTILVTSRRCLGVQGEREIPVAPLPVPEPSRDRVPTEWVPGRGSVLASLTSCPSVALFVDRAQAVQADFKLTAANAAAVAGLCRRLEGIPLSIELAAARVRVLTPQQMLERLDQRFELLAGGPSATDPRHRSLRTALDWSYQLLSPELQRFFARLSVFRGGWTLDAAAAVCRESRALEGLEELQRCSLVVTKADGDEMRYELLETVREYAAEQLTPEEQTELAQQHLEHYGGWYQKTLPGIGGRTLNQRLDEVTRDPDNWRAALDWWVQSGQAREWVLQTEMPDWAMIFLLVRFWWTRGHTSEGLRRLIEILTLPQASAPTPPRAWLLLTAGEFACQQGDFAAADAFLQECLAIYQALEDQRGELRCYGALTVPAWVQGDYARARTFCEQALATARRIGNEREIASALASLGHTVHLEGDLERALALLEEGLQILRMGQEIAWANTRRTAADDPYAYKDGVVHLGEIASVCQYCGEVASARGDYAAAVVYLEESVAISRDLGSLSEAVYALDDLGRVALHQGQWSTAAAHFSECLAFWRQGGNQEGIKACLEGLAAVAAGQGEAEQAARLLGAAAALRESRGVPIPPVECADLDRAMAAARSSLGEERFAVAWAEGRAMPVEQIIAQALQEAPAG